MICYSTTIASVLGSRGPHTRSIPMINSAAIGLVLHDVSMVTTDN